MFLNESKMAFAFTSRFPFGADALFFFDGGLAFFVFFFIDSVPEIALAE